MSYVGQEESSKSEEIVMRPDMMQCCTDRGLSCRAEDAESSMTQRLMMYRRKLATNEFKRELTSQERSITG